MGHFQPFVSFFMMASVERHCGANINHAKKAKAVGKDQADCKVWDSFSSASAPSA